MKRVILVQTDGREVVMILPPDKAARCAEHWRARGHAARVDELVPAVVRKGANK